MLHAPSSTRYLVGGAVGVVVAGGAWQLWPAAVAVLAGWIATALVIVGWSVAVVVRFDSTATADLAGREDAQRLTFDVVLLVACVASLGAVARVLARADGAGEIVEALAGVVLAWAVVQTVYVFRYAHLYYQQRGGIDFNQDNDPDFRDFAYLALTVGMTFQVSDTDITDRSIRHAVTRQAVLSWTFGTGIVAVTINVVASLVR